jgi:hypothetical protein
MPVLGPREAIANDATPAENASMLKNTRQSGQALVAATFGLVALIGATGLAIDIGYLRYQKRLQQSAADSAALAGAGDIAYILDGASVLNAARADSTLNGFTNGGKVTVTVNHPSTVAPSSLNPNSVEVLITVAQPTFFMKIFGIGSANVTARAVAVATGRNCIYTLQNGGPGITGTPTFPPGPPPPCQVVNNESLVAQGAVPAADPLAYLKPPPAPGGCLNGVVTDTIPAPPTLNPVPLAAGRYCAPGGISVNGGRNVTLGAGNYVVTGGGISFNGTGTVSGTDVTLYLRAAGGAVSINTTPGSSRTVNLTAPTAGTRAGILFYQNPGNASTATINGTPGSKFQGAFYFPDAALNLSNTGSNAAYTIAVAKSLALSGTTLFPSDYSSLTLGSPVKTAVLVE